MINLLAAAVLLFGGFVLVVIGIGELESQLAVMGVVFFLLGAYVVVKEMK